MQTTILTTVLTDYLQGNSPYALLVNGKWGSGKTYYYQKELTPIITQYEYKAIYLSLNGIATIGSLEQSLLTKIFVNDNKKEIKRTVKIGEKVLTFLSKRFFYNSVEDLFTGSIIDLISFDKKFICFDDLERCDIPIGQLLGYLNNLIEHKKVKVLIFVDESKMSDQSERYSVGKEKLVGRIVNFEQDITVVIPEIITSYKDKERFERFLINYQQLFCEQLQRIHMTNLRTVFFYFDVLEKMHVKLTNIDDEETAQSVLKFALYIASDFRSGKLVTDDHQHFRQLNNLQEVYFNLDRLQKNEEERNSYAVGFCERYLSKDNFDYEFYPSIYQYILTGHLNYIQFENELNDRKQRRTTPEQREFDDLISYNFRNLSNEQFVFLLNSVTANAKNGKFDIYQYAQLADFLFYFSDGRLTCFSDKLKVLN